MRVRRLGEKRDVYKRLIGKPERKRNHPVKLGIDRKVILQWM
jgi:hypothetical protein